MAGLGRKVFTAGDVLTASDVQNYLMDQTVMNFAGTAARSSAIATPTTGMTTYNQTTQQLESYNGTAYVGMSGLQLIKKQTIGSGVSSVNVTGAFSATYENYKIIVSGGVQSDDNANSLKLGASVTGYNYSLIYSSFTVATPLAAVSNAATIFPFVGGGDSNGSFMNVDVMQPFLAKYTRVASNTYGNSTNIGILNGFHKVATSYTDFTIVAGSGTFTGGTIYVYGYGV